MPATLREWESKTVLMEHLANVGRPSLVVGADAEAPKCFYSFSVDTPTSGQLEIGVISSGHGIKPSWITSPDGRFIVIGHDATVSSVDLPNRRVIAVQRLDGVFFEFLTTGSPGEIVVWHEIGVVKMNFAGDQLWSVSTDILEECQPQPNGTLVLRQQDGGDELVIDLRNGNRIRGSGC